VYLGLDMELGQLMAVKQLGLSHMGATGARGSEHEAAVRRVEKEVNFYRRLSHPHIVRYLVRARGQTRGMRTWPTTVLSLPVRQPHCYIHPRQRTRIRAAIRLLTAPSHVQSGERGGDRYCLGHC